MLVASALGLIDNLQHVAGADAVTGEGEFT